MSFLKLMRMGLRYETQHLRSCDYFCWGSQAHPNLRAVGKVTEEEKRHAEQKLAYLKTRKKEARQAVRKNKA
jgi:ABC-type Fe3+-hydroxamate transport system substrate-binding protein